jgi:hypothetical protein
MSTIKGYVNMSEQKIIKTNTTMPPHTTNTSTNIIDNYKEYIINYHKKQTPK